MATFLPKDKDKAKIIAKSSKFTITYVNNDNFYKYFLQVIVLCTILCYLLFFKLLLFGCCCCC